MLYSGGSFSFLPVMRYLCLSAGSDDCTIFPTNRFLQVSAYILGPPHSVLPCHLLQWPRNTSKLCQGSAVLVTKMDWAVNLPHRSPQTHSLCHWYPAAEIASFPPFPHEHWQVKGLDKSYISLSRYLFRSVTARVCFRAWVCQGHSWHCSVRALKALLGEPGFIKVLAIFCK